MKKSMVEMVDHLQLLEDHHHNHDQLIQERVLLVQVVKRLEVETRYMDEQDDFLVQQISDFHMGRSSVQKRLSENQNKADDRRRESPPILLG